MPTKKNTNKLSQLYRTIDQKELSKEALDTLAKLRLATANFRKQEGKEVDAFKLFFDRLIKNKPTAVKTTPEYKAMIKERRSENGRKAMEARKAKQESRQGQGSEEDSKRPAKPFGWRLRGKHNYRKPTRADIRSGRAYYEARINRADTNRTKFPMLERGGFMAKGGEVDKGGMIYALREFISSGTIANKTDVMEYNDIAKIRTIAIEYYMDNGDVPYSMGELDRIMAYANDKLKSGMMAKGGEIKYSTYDNKSMEYIEGEIAHTERSARQFQQMGDYESMEDRQEHVKKLREIYNKKRAQSKMAQGGVFYTDSHKQGH